MPGIEIANVLAGIPVRDMTQSIAWYTRLLGRGPVAQPMDGLADWHVGTGYTMQLVLDDARAGGGLVTLHVPDIAAAQSSLKEEGIDLPYDDSTSTKVKFGKVCDPDGNSVTIIEALPGFDPMASE